MAMDSLNGDGYFEEGVGPIICGGGFRPPPDESIILLEGIK